jgi:hypothetical protein
MPIFLGNIAMTKQSLWGGMVKRSPNILKRQPLIMRMVYVKPRTELID